jgi:Spy/CpxP family protein refolding chaperone
MYVNQRQKLGALTIFLLITFFSIPAMAGSYADYGLHDEGFGLHEGQPSACGLWRDPAVVEKLGLSDKQIAELKNADFTFRKQQLELKAQLGMLHLEMAKAFSGKTPDEATVRELAGKMADAQGKLFIQHIESRLAAARCLTADQLSKFQADGAQHHGGQPKDQHHDMALYGNAKDR